MKFVYFASLTAVACLAFATVQARSTYSGTALRLHRASLVVDGHNDLAWHLRELEDMGLTKYDLNQVQPKLHTDMVRLKEGGVGAQFWSAYVPAELMENGTAVQTTFEQIDLIHRFVAKYSERLETANTAADILRIHAAGKVASLIGLEGGHSIDNSLETLRKLYAAGARYMTLTHWKNLDWADSANDTPVHHGLTNFGEQVIREMNKVGMLVDISHVSAEVMRHALRVAHAPLIASHSSAYSITENVRNVPDDVLRLVTKNGGVVMVNFYPAYIIHGEQDEADWNPGGRLQLFPLEDEFAGDIAEWKEEKAVPHATVPMVVDHIDHIVKVAGVDHVGLGSDFDGVPLVPDGLEDVSKFPAITEELLRRGYSENDIRKILGMNLVRALQEAEHAKSL
jgi:membrane dipeptidase